MRLAHIPCIVLETGCGLPIPSNGVSRQERISLSIRFNTALLRSCIQELYWASPFDENATERMVSITYFIAESCSPTAAFPEAEAALIFWAFEIEVSSHTHVPVKQIYFLGSLRFTLLSSVSSLTTLEAAS